MASRETRDSAIIPDASALRRVLTVLGVAATPLGAFMLRDESAECIAQSFSTNWTGDQLSAVISVSSDQPSGLLYRELLRIMPNLRFVTLDPMHVTFAYEQTQGGRRTAGSRLLRCMQAKFWRFDSRLRPDQWGPPFTGDVPFRLSEREAFFADQILTGAMSVDHAQRALDTLNGDTPWYSMADYVATMAAFAAVYEPELRRRTHHSGVPLVRLLHHSCQSSRLGFLFNNLRLLHTVPPADQALLPMGTTANEAACIHTLVSCHIGYYS